MNAVVNLVSVAPTLHSSAVLVSLKIGIWNTRRKDKQQTEKVKNDAGAQGNVGAYNKNIMPDFKELEAINKFGADSRNWCKRETVPWTFDGVNVLSTEKLWNGFDQEMQDRQKHFYDMVELVLIEYAQARQIAQFRLNSMFDVNEYPTVDEVRRKFYFEYSYHPVPQTGDFRVDVGNQGLQFLQEQFEREANKAVSEAMASLWDRVKKITETLSNQLRVSKDEKGKMYQSTLDTALDLCAMMKDLNLTGDPKMEQMRRELYSTLNGMDLTDLKKNDSARLSVKQEIDDLLSKFDF
jgi:hypothetical protein